MEKLLSIIVTVYNSEKCLEDLLNTIKNQDLKDCEIIIIDDNSQDNSIQIVTLTLNNLEYKLIKLQENKGVAFARQVGLENANGRYILFVDSDDYIEKDIFYNLKKIILNKDYDCIVFSYKVLENNKTKKIIYPDKSLKKEKIINLLIKNRINGQLWNKIFKRSVINDNNIKFYKNINLQEDYLFFMKFLLHSKNQIFMTNILGYTYVIRKNSLVHNINKEKILCMIKALEIQERQTLLFKKYEKDFLLKKIELIFQFRKKYIYLFREWYFIFNIKNFFKIISSFNLKVIIKYIILKKYLKKIKNK